MSSIHDTLTFKPSQDTGPRHLLVVTEAGTTRVRVPARGEITIGRAPECEVPLGDARASRHHATLYFGDRVTIVDLGSTNGTFVGERRIERDEHVVVEPGVVIHIGTSTLVLQGSVPSPRPRRLHSHGYFEARLEEECLRAAASGAVFAVLRLRCDEAAAKLVEEDFASWLRPSDVVAIYAPNEYELLLQDTDASAGENFARPAVDRIRKRGAQIEVGVAGFPRDGRSPELLVARAGAAIHGAPRSVPSSARRGAMAHLGPMVERVAAGNISVLILGETGAGKEVLATTIHKMSPRASRPLVCLNCAAFTESLLESELFGHERGAFTGAITAKEGLLESASGGTVFLDEIGEMPPGLQARLLRVIEQRQVLRVGALRPRPLDVRFVAATNRDLETEVLRGTFRRDLYFRLNGVTLYVPPLRERVDEIATLANDFILHFSAEAGRTSPPRLSPEALAMLESYDWPGNIRELRNVIERAVLLANCDEISVAHLPIEKMGRALAPPVMQAPRESTIEPRRSSRLTIPDFGEHDLAPPTSPLAFSPVGVGLAGAAVAVPDFAPSDAARTAGDDTERVRIVKALETCAGNQTQAAKLLGISRGTLIARLELYELRRPRRPAP